MDQLRVGIIGTGRISDLHALEYLENPRARIAAVCDNNLDIAQERGRRWGVPENRIYTDYHDLLALPDIDLVDILLPHHLHYQATLDAAAAGKHISLQKPMALTVAQADDMITAANKAGVIFRVFENFIFYPPVQQAKALVDAGEIGELLTIRIKSNSGTSATAWEVPASAQAWRFDYAKNGGGPLVFDDGHHKFALAWHFMGMAEQVHAWIGQTEIAPGTGMFLDSPAIVSWKFANNRYGSLEVVNSPEMAINTIYYAQDDRVELTGTKGVIWITRGHGNMLDVPPVILYRDNQMRTFTNVPSDWKYSFMNATRHFIDSYFKGETPRLTGEQGREVLRFTLAAQESAHTGQTVRLS
ncbi:MAG: Gfo/Idh/MocA family oxidoreductase [Anaerolineae bacterium]|nr:Gfo/Idh/MocA family oxidoreductase [Anaerolineae bacterium]